MPGLSDLRQRSPRLFWLGGMLLGLCGLQVMGALGALLPDMVNLHEATVNDFYRLDVSLADTAPCTSSDCTFPAQSLKVDMMPGIKAELVLPPPVMLRPVSGEAFYYAGTGVAGDRDDLLARAENRVARDLGEGTRLSYFYSRNPPETPVTNPDWSLVKQRLVAVPAQGFVLGVEAPEGGAAAGFLPGQSEWSGLQLNDLTRNLVIPGTEREARPLTGLLFQPVPLALEFELPAAATDNVRVGDAMALVPYLSSRLGADTSVLIGEADIAPGETVPVDGRYDGSPDREIHHIPLPGLVTARTAVADGRFRATLRMEPGALSQGLFILLDRVRTSLRLVPGKLRLVVRLEPATAGEGAAPGFLVPATAVTDVQGNNARVWISMNDMAVPVAVTTLQAMTAGVNQEPMRVVREQQPPFGLSIPAADWAALSHAQRAALYPLRHQLLLRAGTHVLRAPPASLRPGRPLRTVVTGS